MPELAAVRRLSVGAEVQRDGGVHARVWAPACRGVDLVVEGDGDARRIVPMRRESDGHFHVLDPSLQPGHRYWYRLDGDRLRPDPASRFQPDGPHGPSMVVDPGAFAWSDASWTGVRPQGQLLYELHVGTFTDEGTWVAAARELEALARLGITIIEVMPIAEFAGRFGWGYDGVDLYAPTHLYGSPDDLRRFVDTAHGLGLGAILDVVYNHLGPAGNYLGDFSPDYFTDKYTNDWGRALNFEGPAPARAFFVENAGYWIEEFHFDGLRLDATQDIHDASREHVIASIARRARDAAGTRSIYLVAENEPQDTRIVRPPSAGGYGVDALWNDDAHHTAVVALTGRREAYYTDYEGSPQELISSAKYGYLYQGQHYSWQKQRRGSPGLDLPPSAFVSYLENHDQVANSAFGRRLHQLAAPSELRALTAWLLLGPATPMLFQGQEFAASAPFQYFADHTPELNAEIDKGRREFLSQFASVADRGIQASLPNATDPATFERCRLDRHERETHRGWYGLHRDLIALRRTDAVIARGALARPDGAVLGPGAFLLRYFGAEHDDRLLVINLQGDLEFTPAREPLLAPPPGAAWRLAWSSEAVAYGGQGTPPVGEDGRWRIPGRCALLFRPLGV
jgi:maltooligosyltrehalose trehalohydrolase